MTRHHSLNYVEFPATDLDAVQAFYASVFGWTFIDYGPTYRAFNDGSFDGGFTTEASMQSPGALVIVYSEKLEETLASVASHGGIITKDIYTFPGGRRFHFTDPSGNELAVWSDK